MLTKCLTNRKIILSAFKHFSDYERISSFFKRTDKERIPFLKKEQGTELIPY